MLLRHYTCLQLSFMLTAVLAMLVAFGSKLSAAQGPVVAVPAAQPAPPAPGEISLQGYLKRDIVMFGASWCPYCNRVKRALTDARLEFLFVDAGAEMRRTLTAKTGQRTVPYVFIRGRFIGGCNDGPVRDPLP